MNYILSAIFITALFMVSVFDGLEVARLQVVHSEEIRALKLEQMQETNMAFTAGWEVGGMSMHEPIDNCDLHHVIMSKKETKAANLRAQKLAKLEVN